MLVKGVFQEKSFKLINNRPFFVSATSNGFSRLVPYYRDLFEASKEIENLTTRLNRLELDYLELVNYCQGLESQSSQIKES